MPRLNISQETPYLAFEFFKLTTSGATYPGVPHLLNKNSFLSAYYASPKSAITQVRSF